MTLNGYEEKCMRPPGAAETAGEIRPGASEEELVRALAAVRISRGISQKDLSEKTGVAQSEISRLENGKRKPSLDVLRRLADGMGMELRISFGPKGQAGEGGNP